MFFELLSNLIGSLLLYYDFILHSCTFYGVFKLLILHGFTFLVDSIDLSVVCGQLQSFRSMQLSSLY